jgi:predicted 3-demethylubiquinone-9 3-methyltransferase (glyoxalase superfamily)
VPDEVPALLGDPDPARADAAMRAMLALKKIDIQAVRDEAAR